MVRLEARLGCGACIALSLGGELSSHSTSSATPAAPSDFGAQVCCDAAVSLGAELSQSNSMAGADNANAGAVELELEANARG
jgi:hypothetical protein